MNFLNDNLCQPYGWRFVLTVFSFCKQQLKQKMQFNSYLTSDSNAFQFLISELRIAFKLKA